MSTGLGVLDVLVKHGCRLLYSLDCAQFYKCGNIHVLILSQPDYKRIIVIDGALLFNKPIPITLSGERERDVADLLDAVISARRIEVVVTRT